MTHINLHSIRVIGGESCSSCNRIFPSQLACNVDGILDLLLHCSISLPHLFFILIFQWNETLMSGFKRLAENSCESCDKNVKPPIQKNREQLT